MVRTTTTTIRKLPTKAELNHVMCTVKDWRLYFGHNDEIWPDFDQLDTFQSGNTDKIHALGSVKVSKCLERLMARDHPSKSRLSVEEYKQRDEVDFLLLSPEYGEIQQDPVRMMDDEDDDDGEHHEDVWEKMWHEETGVFYYYNVLTMQAVGEHVQRENEQQQQQLKAVEEEMNQENRMWKKLWNEERQMHYYVSDINNEIRWERPDNHKEPDIEHIEPSVVDENRTVQEKHPIIGPWKKVWDEERQSFYYYNRVNGQMQRDLPEDFKERSIDISSVDLEKVVPRSDDADESTSWVKKWNQEYYHFYYCNTVTGESRWSQPDGFDDTM